MSKPAFTYKQQLELLKSRGLCVPNELAALQILEHHNYYRLSAYRLAFTVPGQPNQFQPGTTFAQLWDLYHFDRSLRQLVMEACKHVEISSRSRWAYAIGHSLAPLAYLENVHFSDPLIHARTLTKLDSEMSRSKEEFIKHHKTTLGMPWPPAWAITEIASFGSVSTLISQLRHSSIRQAIADGYGLDEQVFGSLLHHLCVLRNTAAHHSRLWNRKFVITFQLPRKKPAGGGNFRRIHNSLILLVHLLQCIDPATDWPRRLIHLLQTLDPALIPEMGFPPDWKTRPVWQGLLAIHDD